MSEEKKKRGRPKGSKNKEKAPKVEEVVRSYDTTEDFTMKRKENFVKTRAPVKAGVNKWVDDGQLEEDDFDTKVIRKQRPQDRPKASTKEVVCSACGRRSQVPSSLPVSSYYRCEKCIGN